MGRFPPSSRERSTQRQCFEGARHGRSKWVCLLGDERPAKPSARLPRVGPSDPRLERMDLPNEFAAELLGVIVHCCLDVAGRYIEIVERKKHG